MNFLGNVKSQYKRADIIKALTENKDKHLDEYLEAMKIYKEELGKRLAAASLELAGGKVPKIEYNMGLQQPELRTDQYDNILNVFACAQEDIITLSVSEASVIFNDEWPWIASAKIVNSSYTSRSF